MFHLVWTNFLRIHKTRTSLVSDIWHSSFVGCTVWNVSQYGAFLVCIFPHSDWICRYTKYLSLFSPNTEKYGPEKNSIFRPFSRSITFNGNVILCHRVISKYSETLFSHSTVTLTWLIALYFIWSLVKIPGLYDACKCIHIG